MCKLGVALGFVVVGYVWVVVFVSFLTVVLLGGCGGTAEQAEEFDMLEQTAHTPAAVQLEQHWCCRHSASQQELYCGYEFKPGEFALCYCAGRVRYSQEGAECEDVTLYTPGSLCTAAGLVCL